MNRGKTRRVLVIDDDHEIRAVIKHALTRAGYDVEATPELSSAVGASLTGDYSVITLDLSMPETDMQGEEVAELLSRRSVATPVVVISGYLTDPAIERLRGLGIRYFVKKPFGVADVVETVGRAIAEVR